MEESEGKLIQVTALWGHIHYSPAVTLLSCRAMAAEGTGGRNGKGLKRGPFPLEMEMEILL